MGPQNLQFFVSILHYTNLLWIGPGIFGRKFQWTVTDTTPTALGHLLVSDSGNPKIYLQNKSLQIEKKCSQYTRKFFLLFLN